MTQRTRTQCMALTTLAAVGAISIAGWSQTMPSTSTTSPTTRVAASQPFMQSATHPATADGNYGGGGNRRRGIYPSSVPTPSSFPTSSPTTTATGRRPSVPLENFTERYGVLAERNIFVRDRKPAPPAGSFNTRTDDRQTPPPPSLESLLVLRGIVFDDVVYHAYFENTQSLEMVRVAAGDTLAHGRVGEISVDAIAYETERGTAWVNVGDNLAGVHVAPTSAPSATTLPGSSGATGGNPALSAVEERLRQQRLQRTGGR